MRVLLTIFLGLGLAAARCPAPSPLRPRPHAFSNAFYVSLAGNDSWSGTLPSPTPTGDDGPFLTPSAAESAVQSLLRPLTADVYVYLRAGVYHLNSTLALAPGSGGDGPSARVRWASYPPDGARSAVLSGGAPVTGWAPSGAPGVWVAPLPPTAPARSRGLFVNDVRRWPARVPSPAGPQRSDWASDASSLHFASSLNGCGAPPASCWDASCGNASNAGNNFGFVFNASDGRSPKQGWADVPGVDVLVFGAWTAAWSSVRAVFDANSTLLVTTPLSTARPGAWMCQGGQRYILFNVREALAPLSGEYYVDDAARMVYYAPTAGEGSDPGALRIVVPVLDTVVSVQGDDCGGPIEFLDLVNLTIAHATDGGFGARAAAYQASVGALRFTSAMDCTVSGVAVQATDGSGIFLEENLIRLTIASSLVQGVGGDGIGCASNSADGTGEPVNTTIKDSVIDGVGLIFHNQPGAVRVKGDVAGTVTVEHNLVRDSSYAGIMVSWQDGTTRPPEPVQWRFIVRGNLVEDCGNSILSDFGGIYVSSSGEQCQATQSCYIPTLVEGNSIRNVRAYDYGGEGIYTDENVAGVYITGNAVGNVSGAALYLHCGLNHSVVNNIFWGAKQASGPHFTGSGGGLVGACNTGGVEPQWTNISALLQRNVFELTVAGSTLFNAGQTLGAEAYSSNVWWVTPAAGTPDGLRWLGNVSTAPLRTWQQWQAGGQDVQGAVADPLIADAAGSDFHLLPGSPALALGFEQLFSNGPPGPRQH